MTPPILTIYYRTRLLERFPTDRPGVMGCRYRHVGIDDKAQRWEVEEVWIEDKREVIRWKRV